MIHYFIPAREGSKGLPFKNRKLFHCTAGILTEEQCKQTIVSTDDEVVKNLALDYNMKVKDRPSDLASDTANTRDVLLHGLKEYSYYDDIVVMLYLTYPKRTAQDLSSCLNYFLDSGAMSLLCRKPIRSHPYLMVDEHGKKFIDHDLYRRQDYPVLYEISHFFFISYLSEIPYLNKNLYNEATVFFDIKDTVDVDTSEDLVKIIQ